MRTETLCRGAASWEVTWMGKLVEVLDEGVLSRQHFSTPRGANEAAKQLVAARMESGWHPGEPEPALIDSY